MAHKPPTQLQGITDLTVTAAIKPGLIDGAFESRSYTWRLQRVLGLLDAARHASQEADLLPSPFVDSVGQFRGIHFFRFAILPSADRTSADRLLLNVTFDGGWEPYMRLIWGPLGTMLDVIFCHCRDDGYPLAAASSYDDYIRWVREHEVPGRFFYADSCGTVADRAYLSRLEAQQRTAGDQAGADLRAAQTALGTEPPPRPTPAAVAAALRKLKGVHGLVPYFGPPSPAGDTVAPDDGSVLLRFAQDFLPDLRQWVAQGLFDPGQPFGALRPQFGPELDWLMTPRWRRPAKRDRAQPLKAHEVQAGILQPLNAPDGRHVRGALVLVRVVDPEGARRWLASASKVGDGQATRLIRDGSLIELAGDDVACTVAITHPGLQQLGAKDLDRLPGEFIQGMEARAGVLGDLRLNHPQQWRRPRATWGNGAAAARPPLDPALVHLVIQLRTCEADDESAGRDRLLPRLGQWITDNLVREASIEVLTAEPTWSKPRASHEPASRDHFGYVDGISQPTLAPSPGSLFWDDTVRTGEILLGWMNDRGDGPPATPEGQEPATPASPAWLDLGTFLVVRKIRQYPERLDAIVDKAADALVAAGIERSSGKARELVRAKLMGRGSDGSPLTVQRGPGTNDFDYGNDASGMQCPFTSHVRRANPRAATAGPRPPRIVRRGMAYGPAPADPPPPQDREPAERGTLFMAYNASIAEQFEVIQRWLTGGNSSGASSSQSDPFLGVPRLGEPAVFRFVHDGRVIRVDLGDQPVCRLEWGLYAFVPSMALLQDPEALTVSDASDARQAAPAAPARKRRSAKEVRARLKAAFEDDIGRKERWEKVRNRNGGVGTGVEKIGTTVMVGGFDAVMTVLKDDGSLYSASGYGKRMKATLGASPFGQDDAGPNRGHEPDVVEVVKRAIETSVSEAQAYDQAYLHTTAILTALLAGSEARGAPDASVDIVTLINGLIARLCKTWFAVAYEPGVTEAGGLAQGPEPVRCPGHFLSVARNIFSAYPNDKVKGLAKVHGEALKKRVPDWIEAAQGNIDAPVMQKILAALPPPKDPKSNALDLEQRNGIVANVMLGLPATLLGSLTKVLLAWIGDRRLWQLQHDLGRLAVARQDGQEGPPIAHAQAKAVLRPALIATLAADPVADGIWRTVARSGAKLRDVNIDEGDVVWLGLGSALIDKPGDAQVAEDLLFGGSRDPDSDLRTPHACPGRGLAIGTMLGALSALLAAGTLASTPGPTVLTLTRLQPSPVPVP